MKSLWNTKRLGLTLVELVVVIAILGVLAAMLLPKLEGLSGIAGHTSTASSASSLANIIGSQYQLKRYYPDGWDTLTDGSSLWAGTGGSGGNPALAVKGLHSELVDATNPRLSTTQLNAAQIAGLVKVGISTLYNVNTASTLRPGDMFTTKTVLSGTGAATNATVAIINPTSARGKQVIDHVYRQNQQTGAVSGTLPANTQLVVFGLGPQSRLVIDGTILEAPVYSNANAQYIYNRLLVVFAMTNTVTSGTDGSGNPTSDVTAASFKFKTILGADGDLMDDMSVNAQTGSL